jgi:hypothetical protein
MERNNFSINLKDIDYEKTKISFIQRYQRIEHCRPASPDF